MSDSTSMEARPTHVPSADLGELLQVAHRLDATARITGTAEVTVHGLSLATDRLQPGDLFAALPGTRVHGASFAGEAIERGAVAVLTDAAGEALVREQLGDSPDVGVLVVSQVRGVLGELAAGLFAYPARRLTMLGVTGTQGKTTTTRLLQSALEAAGVSSAVVGTVGTRVGHRDVATALTTPEAPDLQGLLAAMVEHEVAVCAMEVSSHALVLGRVDGVVFDVATFLNLGRDHLDFHPDVDSYFRAKAELFSEQRSRRAVVNLDDEHGRLLVGELRAAGRHVVTFALDRPADWTAEEVVLVPDGSRFVLVGPDHLRVPVRVPLVGRYNVSNALAALVSAAEAGLDVRAVAAHFADSGGVPGRMEAVRAGQEFAVVVDYAHKPDAVEAACATLRQVTSGRLIVVLGAGGDRDTGKRPVMGEIAARLADVVIVTDDNPRSEDPAAIRAAVLEGALGADGQAEIMEIGDRSAAIAAAVAMAGPHDAVLVAGKGHESGQEVGGVKYPFDDREVAAHAIKEAAQR